MESTVQELNRVDLITISGRVDSSNASDLGTVLNDRLDAGRRNLVVDMSEVEYISSAGLRELVAALKRAQQAAGDLRLAAPSERVHEVLELAGLADVFDIYESQVEAVGSF